jgi:hypothetical protein
MPEGDRVPVGAVETDGVCSGMDEVRAAEVIRPPAPALKIIVQFVGIDGEIRLGSRAASLDQQGGAEDNPAQMKDNLHDVVA